MALPCWQEPSSEDASITAVKVSFKNAKKFFAVDCSGSTSGAIMKAQHRFLQGLHSNAEDQVTKWDHSCRDPGLVDGMPDAYYAGMGGTSPENISKSTKTVKTIKDSEVWVLLTDGQVAAGQVTELAKSAYSMDFIQVPVIFLITGARYTGPEHTNISVGIPFFASAQQALILFKDYASGQIYVIDAKGMFEPLKATKSDCEAEYGDLSAWNSLPMYLNEKTFCKACENLGMYFDHDPERRTRKSISLGLQWASFTNNALVNVSELLKQVKISALDLQNLLRDEAINHLALICKTRDQIADLRNLLIRHKKQEVMIRLEDRHGASDIMEKIRNVENSAEKTKLVVQLREAHALNRNTYQRLRDCPSDESRLAADINRSINRALVILSDYEKSSYTADILNRKSNRAMRAGVVSAADAEIHISALELSDEIEAYRSTCSICCGDEQIMSIVLKELETVEENTTDFALNFPLAAGWSKHNQDMVSSQCICFQCALLLERSIFQENIVAKIPAVSYRGPNKKYIEHQLYLAITAGLSTGASGILQLFSTILDRTLETKDWCSGANIEDPEVLARRQVLDWTLRNLLQNCSCREDFSETGRWVKYPEALRWATKNYADAMLDSWIIQYPLAGFNQLLQWYSFLGVPVCTPLEIIKKAKLIHLTTTAMMNGLRDERNRDKSWTYPFLELVYQGFNAPGVPRDLGKSSIVSPDYFWTKLETALGAWDDVVRFLKQFNNVERREIVLRVQLVIFWALFTQKGHTMPKTFFQNIMDREPLATLVLDPKAPVSSETIHDVLMSIFVPNRNFDKQHSGPGVSMPPFVSPYGPSVLECGFPKCGLKFFDAPKRGETVDPVDVRERRTKHLQQSFGVGGNFTSQTGLPEPTKAPKAPTSYHNNMHISIARTWNTLNLDQKRYISAEVGRQTTADDTCTGSQDAISNFAAAVRVQICAESGRGDIYSATIEDEFRQILPSFLDALRVASRKLGLQDQSGLDFLHDWTQNTIVWKMEYELSL